MIHFHFNEIFICCIYFILLFIMFVSYNKLKRHFSKDVTVNCWFCNLNTVVPRGNKNCWTCPYCDQYNGFKNDGDYNKCIPSQYDENINYGIGAIINKTYQFQPLYFCELCNEKQNVKIKLLNQFQGKENDEKYFKKYKEALEIQYGLCCDCNKIACEIINSANNRVLHDYMMWSAKQSRIKMNENRQQFSYIKHLNIIPVSIITLLFTIQIIAYSSFFVEFRKSSLIDIILQYQNAFNALAFSIVFLLMKFGNLRPSIVFTDLQLLIFVAIIPFDYCVNHFKRDKYNKLLKLSILVGLFSLFANFLWKFLSLIMALSFTKFSFVSIVPTGDLSLNEGNNKTEKNSKSSYFNPFKTNKLHSIYEESSNRVFDSNKLSKGNILKQSKLNFVVTPSVNDLRSVSQLSSKYNSIASQSLYAWNFDSASQCRSVGCLSSKPTTEHSMSRISYRSAKSTLTRKSINSKVTVKSDSTLIRYSKMLLKYLLGAVIGVGLNLLSLLALSYMNVDIESYLNLK